MCIRPLIRSQKHALRADLCRKLEYRGCRDGSLIHLLLRQQMIYPLPALTIGIPHPGHPKRAGPMPLRQAATVASRCRLHERATAGKHGTI